MNDKNISFEWNEEKNDLLKNTRNISFEDIILAINEGNLLDVIKNQSSNHSGQYCFVVGIEKYAYVVPFIKDGNRAFLKTIFPDRGYTKIYFDKKL